MAVTNWLARALARAQVSTVTPGGTIEVGDIFYCTINGKSISFTATGTTVANVVAGLVAAWNTSTIIEFTEITASDSSTHMTLTSDTAGVPFTVTVSTTESDGSAADAQLIATATTTAATGPNHWDDANNWDGGAVPVNGDEANVDLSKGSIYYGLAQSAVTLAVLNVFRSTQTQNRLGLPLINAGGYTEYRKAALEIGATLALYDANCPYAVNYGSVQTATEVRQSYGASNGVPEARFLGTNASNTYEINGGTASIGLFPGVAAAGATLRVGQGGSVVCGPDCVFTDVINMGQSDYRGTFTDFLNEGGQATISGVQNASGLTIDGGTVYKRFTGTIAQVVVGPGTLDSSGHLGPATFTDTSLEPGGSIIDPGNSITRTNGVVLEDGWNQISLT